MPNRRFSLMQRTFTRHYGLNVELGPRGDGGASRALLKIYLFFIYLGVGVEGEREARV